MAHRKVLLTILDGWGIGDKSEKDVISQGDTPFWDSLLETYPNSRLDASGEAVGLPDGQMGNSEVGHMNIGAGRVVYQELVRINKAIEDGSLAKNKVINDAFDYAIKNKKKMHLIGLVSDGGVHSSEKHLYAICDIAKEKGFDELYIHVLTDGRDTDPKSGYGYVKELQEYLEHSSGTIASLAGRYYTMDRDKRWERIKLGYDLLVKGEGKHYSNILDAIEDSYSEGVTDEFIKPVVIVDDNDKPYAPVEEGDVFFCFNFRTDRLRQITTVLTQEDMPEHNMHTIDLYYVTMTQYDESFKNIHIVFEKTNVNMSIGEYLSANGLSQLRIAETEKYAHVTFFFSGGREEEFDKEDRILIHSPKVATYDLQPEMSAYKVKDALLDDLKTQKHDFICLNFANGDMVGHTGIYEAILKAVHAVDECLEQVIATALENGYEAVIIADHGNADYAVNDDGSPNTAHSLNQVPCIVVSARYDSVNDGILADVAPTILDMMGLEKPDVMTGKSLLQK
jgi:2,3-bisphosphoglycerate-independent phosphoglycerate mutase